ALKHIEVEVLPRLSLRDPRAAMLDQDLRKLIDKISPYPETNDWEDLAEDLDAEDEIVAGRTGRLTSVIRPRAARASFPIAGDVSPLPQNEALDLFVRAVFLSEAVFDSEDLDEITLTIESGGTISGAARNLVSVLASTYLECFDAKVTASAVVT